MIGLPPGDAAATARISNGLNALVMAARVAMVVTDPTQHDNPIVAVNEAFCRLTGYCRDELLGRNCRLLRCGQTDPAAVGRLRDAVARAEPIEIELLNARSDGSLFWNRLLVAPLFDLDGRVVRYFSAQLDVTEDRERFTVLQRQTAVLEAEIARRSTDVVERKRAEQQARLSERRFQALLEAMPTIVWTADADGETAYTSGSFSTYTGLAGGAIGCGAWIEATHPEDNASVRSLWREAVDHARHYKCEARLRRHDGVYRWFLISGMPLHDETGSGAVDWCGTAIDIEDEVRAREALADSHRVLAGQVVDSAATLGQVRQALQIEAGGRARAEQALRQAHKMEAIGQLTGGIAHDFNNLLTVISGSLDLLSIRLGQGDLKDAARYIESARRAVDRGAGLTHRLLAFARQQTLDPRPVVADRLVSDIVELIGRSVGPPIKVVTRLDSQGAHILCDASELQRVMLNLAINARDAMPQGGQLMVSTARRQLNSEDVAGLQGIQPGDELQPGAYVEIAVADTGTGMTEAVRLRAFDPFFTTKPIGKGTGLGLSQAYGFVRQSGGFVILETVPGAGTTVRLLLSRGSETLVAEVAKTGRVAAGSEMYRAVLLVEDEEPVRNLVAEALVETGWAVTAVADGEAALAILQGPDRFDLLVSDVGLPGLNGRALAEAARQAQPALPILLMTGYAGELLHGLGPVAGVDVLGKPFTMAVLNARISAMMAGPSAEEKMN